MLLTLIGAALSQEVVSQEIVVPVPQDPPVEILYTGHRGGVSSGIYPFSTFRLLRKLDAEPGLELTAVEVFNGTLAQDDWLLRAADRRLGSVLALLDGSPITCGMPGPVPALVTDTDIAVLDRPGETALFEALVGDTQGELSEHVVRVCRNDVGVEALLTGPSISEPRWELSAFEMRKSLKLDFSDGSVVTLTGMPIQEASRTMATLTALKTPGVLYMDAGDFVDGASTVRPGKLSQHRPLGFEMLRRLEPAALAPGHTELVGGAAVFLSEIEGLPYVATNWSAADLALELAPYRIITTDDGRRVGVIAVLDPQLLVDIPDLVHEGITITDPVESVQPVIDEMHALPQPPDTVIVLTTASSEVMTELRRRLRGVDVMLGDATFATLRIEERDVIMRPLPPGVKAAPLTLSMDGVTTVRLVFDGDDLRSVVSTPQLVRGDVSQDDTVRARITATRAETYPPLDVPLVPDLFGTQPMSQADWSQLVCEAVRSATSSDTVLLRALPPVRSLPGPLTELQLLDQLGILDQLVAYDIPGGSMTTLMDRSYGVAPVACGATVSSKKARGRSIESDRTYRVVTTNHTIDDPQIGGLLESLKPTRLLDGPGSRPLQGADGAPLLLSQTVVDQLRGVRDSGGGPAAVSAWLESAPGAVPPMWLLRMRQVDLQLVRFQGTENDAFAEVPETLATSPSSVTLSSAADVALERSSARISADLRFVGSYASQRIIGEEFAESADDWKLSTSGTLPGLAFPATAKLSWMPYSELLYDSELTPTLDEDGAENLRQADLSLAAGLSSKSWGVLKNVRVGGFANQDIARLGDKPTEFGGKTTWETALKVSGLTWSTDGDLQVFASTSQDDASDLRLKFTGETRLAMPLARFLSIDLYAQGFALKGRVAANEDLGFSWTLGSSLDVSGAFEL
ncbi:MAG: hypothetical protein ACI8RZ_003917 [Myxococcota bacterium]|jgi:hypothetical protein